MYDKVLKVDLQGNVINILHPNSHIRISDISFYKDELVIWSPSIFENLIFYRDTLEFEAAVLKIHATNENNLSSLSAVPFYFEAAMFLTSVNDRLYIYDRTSFLAFDWLTKINVTTRKKYFDKPVYVNSQMRKPLNGFPISECETAELVYQRKVPLNKYNIDIHNFCTDTTIMISKFLTGDSCRNCKIYPSLFFKNDYLDNYFFFGSWISDTSISKNPKSILVFLDHEFNVYRIGNSIEYFQDDYGPSPRPYASFTCDERGNVYYCTNYFNRADIQNSFIKIFKIGSNK